ncbi:MAG: AAA family ATPase, partial [bacterium]|nr:AAA family ATPase [bacterium]
MTPPPLEHTGQTGTEATLRNCDEAPLEALPPGMVEELETGTEGSSPPEVIQTHISHILLTADRVYKIRKAVRFPFLSFATRIERNEDCLREIRLNRRLAPDVYLGVAPLLRRDGHWIVGDVAEGLCDTTDPAATPEHCVVMRRLRTGADAQSLVEKGLLTSEHVQAVADRVAKFHAANSLGCPAPYAPEAWRNRIEAPVRDTLETIVARTPDDELGRMASQLIQRSRYCLDQLREALEERRATGRAVDGHGDLQLAHVWFDGPGFEPSIIDCTEFNEDFRRIDSASEVAFFAMDLTYRGQGKQAEWFLARYARQTDDFGLYSLVDYYASYRAAVRAKVAVLAALEPEIAPQQREAALHSARSHLELAASFLEPRPGASVTLVCGTVGSGKSTVAAQCAETLPAVVVSSDRTRKRLAGIRDDDHSAARGAPRTGLYSETRTEEVYGEILERAAPVVDSGRHVILDASFSRAGYRSTVRDWARRRGIHTRLLKVTCSRDTALERLAQRERNGRDPSDAGPSLHQWSVDNFEPPSEW